MEIMLLVFTCCCAVFKNAKMVMNPFELKSKCIFVLVIIYPVFFFSKTTATNKSSEVSQPMLGCSCSLGFKL